MSEPEFELGAYIAHLPPDLEGVAAPLYRRMAFISVSLLPTLRAGTGAGQDLPALEADLQAALAESQEKLSELQLAGDDYDPPLSDIVFAASEGGARDLKRIRATAQEAILHARRAVRAQARAEPLSGVKARAVLGLDTGGAYRSYRTSGAEGGDQVAQASSDMTTALERAVTLMSEELGKSTFSAELLQESSDAMAQLSGSYTSFEGLLQTSQAMVKKLKRQDVQDRIAVLASLTFFVLCVLYILKQRLVDPSFGGVAGLATGTYRTLRWGARLFTPASTAAVAGLAPPATTMSAAVAGMTSGSTAGAGLAFGATSSSGQARPIPSSAPVVPSAEKEPTWLATGVLEAERAPQATEWVWEHDPVLDAEWDTMAHSPEDTHAGTRLNSEVPSPPPTENEALYARQDIHAPHSINQSSFSEHVGVPQQEEDSGQAPITEETETATLQELEEATPREQAPSTSKSPLQELEKATPREHTQSTPKCPLTSEEAGEPYLTEGNLPSEHKVEFSGVIEGEASLTMEADSSVPREFQEADTLPQQADGALTMLGDRWVGPEIINAETTGDDRPVAEEGPCDDPQPPLQGTSEAIVNAGTSTARAGAAGRTEPGRSAAQPSAASPASVGSVAASHVAPRAPDPGESEEPLHKARGHAVSDGVLDLFPVHDVAASSFLGRDDATAAQGNTGMEETAQVPGHPGTETEATADTIIQAEPEPQLQPRPRPASVSEPRDGGSSGFASRDPHSARKEPELVVGDPASVPTEPKDEDFQAEHVRTRDAEISATLSSSGAAQQPYARHDDL